MRLHLVCIAVLVLGLTGGCHREPETPSKVPYVPGRLLNALGEAPLPPLAVGNTNHVYRFICNRTFHEPFCIVLSVGTNGAGAVTMKMLSGQGGYDLGVMKEQRQTALTPGQVESLLGLLQREGFWSLAPSAPDSEVGLDGSDWFIEGVRTNRYHIVKRWSPEETAPVGRIGRRLIELSGWKIEHLY